MKRLAGLFGLALLCEALRISLLARLPFHPDLLLGIVVLAALSRTPPLGALIGFLLGLIRDLLYGNPAGFDALPLALVGWVVGSLGRSVYRDSLITHVVVLFGAAVAKGMAGFLILRGGELSGMPLYFARTVLPGALATAFLVPAVWRWIRAFFAQGGSHSLKRILRSYERKLFVKRS